VAAMAVEREVFVDQFSEERLADPKIMAFMKKISVEIDAAIDARGPARRDGVRLKLRTRGGQELTAEKDWRPGSPEDPMAHDEIVAKFRRLAHGRWPEDKTQRIIDAVDDLPKLASLEPIFESLRA